MCSGNDFLYLAGRATPSGGGGVGRAMPSLDGGVGRAMSRDFASAGSLPGRTATFQGLPSLDGGGQAESRDFVYSARLEADKFGRPAPVKHWPGLVLEDPSATAAAINAWASHAPTTATIGRDGAREVAAGTGAPVAQQQAVPAAGVDSGKSWADVRRSSSDGSADETDGTSDGEYADRQQPAGGPHPVPTAHSVGGWDAASANPLLAAAAALPRSEKQQGNGWFPNPIAAHQSVPQQAAPRQMPPAAEASEDTEPAPVCPFCPAAYDEAVGAEPGRKTRRVRPKAVSRTTQKHGRWWQTLGYGGPAYCQRCSEVFRDHIIREKPNSAQCSRGHPCDECAGLLQHFVGGVDLLWQKIDARSYASDSKRQGASKTAQKKQRLR